MGALGQFNVALMNAANTTTNVLSDYAKRRSDFKLSTDSINFQNELNFQMRELQKTDGWRQQSDGTNQWEKDIDTFFNNKLEALSDENSPSYATNNYEYRAMQEYIQKSRIQAKDQVAKMAWQRQGEQMVVDYNNSLQQLRTMTQGQDYIDQANAGARELLSMGLISSSQYDTMIKNNFTTGYFDYYANQLDASMDQAIKDGETFDTLFTKIVNGKDDMKLYGPDGIEIKMDREVINNQLKKTEKQLYDSKVSEIQTNNYKDHEKKFNQIDDVLLDIIAGKSVDYNRVYNICNVGLEILKTQTGLQLAKGEQSNLSDKYVRYMDTLKDLQKAGKSGSGSNNLPSYETIIIKGSAETYAQGVAEGKITPIAAEESLQKIYAEEFFNKDWKETAGMTKEDKEQFYLLKYQNTAAQKILSDPALNKIAEKKYPTEYNYLKTLEKEVQKDIVKDPKDRIYDADTLATMTKFVLDSAAEGTDPEEFRKKWDSMLKACTIKGLNNMFEKRHFMESENDQIARHVNEMSENDIVFLTTNGEEIWAGGETAKSKYDETAKTFKSFIEQNLDGVTLSQPTYRKTKYDIDPVPEYKGSDGNTYHLEVEQSGKKKIPVIVDQNGNRYNAKDLNAEDKAAKKASKQKVRQAKEDLAKKEDELAEEMDNTIINTKEVPDKVVAAGSISNEDWKDSENNLRLRYYQLNETIGVIDKASNNKKISNEEFKSKYGLSKEQWKNMKGQTARYKYLMS